MNIRRPLATFLAGVAAVSSLAVGLTAQPAHADGCEVEAYRSLHVNDVSVIEGNKKGFTYYTPAKFNVKTTGCMRAGSVYWQLAPALASEPGDHTDSNDLLSYPSGTLTWAYGESATKVITATIVRDSLPENHEKFKLLFANKPFGFDNATGAVATGTILDDDTPPPA